MLGHRATRGWSVAWAALLFGTALALAVVPLAISPSRAQEALNCASRQGPQVPGAERQDVDWCSDLATRTLFQEDTQETQAEERRLIAEGPEPRTQ